ncbi:acyl-CoA-binding protein [Lysobacter sp. A3-1-A15]|uniref:acyl-CoA-binding protein n=1 Tax=Novilysobacter viscosus TaxID=3098602 RepID=UPI002EDA4E70
MTDLDDRFDQALQDVQSLGERPDNEVLLKLYALYKQATEGDVQGEKPGFFDFVGSAKYEAWLQVKGVDANEAKQRYIDLVAQLHG